MIRLTERQIAEYIAEPKALPSGWEPKLGRRKQKRGHSESDLTIYGDRGTLFKIITRVSSVNTMNFSAILAMMPAGSYELFRLRRYNGRSHEHTNAIEGDRFYDFHIHLATERYQALGLKEDGYAVAAATFSDLRDALYQLADECAFKDPDPRQTSLGTLSP